MLFLKENYVRMRAFIPSWITGGRTAPKLTDEMDNKKEQRTTRSHDARGIKSTKKMELPQLPPLSEGGTHLVQINGLFDDIIKELNRIANTNDCQATSVTTGSKRKRGEDGSQEDEPVIKLLKTEK